MLPLKSIQIVIIIIILLTSFLSKSLKQQVTIIHSFSYSVHNWLIPEHYLHLSLHLITTCASSVSLSILNVIEHKFRGEDTL